MAAMKLPTAQEVMEKLAWPRPRKLGAVRKHAAAEAEKKALIEKLTKPSGLSDDEALRRAAAIIERAVTNGLTEVQVIAFPTRSAPTMAAQSTSKSRAGRRH